MSAGSPKYTMAVRVDSCEYCRVLTRVRRIAIEHDQSAELLYLEGRVCSDCVLRAVHAVVRDLGLPLPVRWARECVGDEGRQEGTVTGGLASVSVTKGEDDPFSDGGADIISTEQLLKYSPPQPLKVQTAFVGFTSQAALRSLSKQKIYASSIVPVFKPRRMLVFGSGCLHSLEIDGEECLAVQRATPFSAFQTGTQPSWRTVHEAVAFSVDDGGWFSVRPHPKEHFCDHHGARVNRIRVVRIDSYSPLAQIAAAHGLELLLPTISDRIRFAISGELEALLLVGDAECPPD